MSSRHYDPLLDGDVCRRIPGMPRHEPLELVSLPVDLVAAPLMPGEVVSGIQFDAEGSPTAYVIPAARTRDADLPQVGSFHG